MVWKLNDVLSASLLDNILESIQKRQHEARVVTSENTKPKFCYSGFHYLQLPLEESLRRRAFDSIIKALSLVDTSLNPTSGTSEELSYSNLFLKGFTPGSHYHLHAEDQKVFGSLAYILYLSDEDSGSIVFPKKADLNKVANHEELKNWYFMDDYLSTNQTIPKYLPETLELLPRKNQLVAFRTGLVHKVEEYRGCETGRFCFTGFPGAIIP